MSKPVMSSPNFGVSTDRFLEGFQGKNQKRHETTTYWILLPPPPNNWLGPHSSTGPAVCWAPDVGCSTRNRRSCARARCAFGRSAQWDDLDRCWGCLVVGFVCPFVPCSWIRVYT
jgi:hypothetical protein